MPTLPHKWKRCSKCGSPGHTRDECGGLKFHRCPGCAKPVDMAELMAHKHFGCVNFTNARTYGNANVH